MQPSHVDICAQIILKPDAHMHYHTSACILEKPVQRIKASDQRKDRDDCFFRSRGEDLVINCCMNRGPVSIRALKKILKTATAEMSGPILILIETFVLPISDHGCVQAVVDRACWTVANHFGSLK